MCIYYRLSFALFNQHNGRQRQLCERIREHLKFIIRSRMHRCICNRFSLFYFVFALCQLYRWRRDGAHRYLSKHFFSLSTFDVSLESMFPLSSLNDFCSFLAEFPHIINEITAKPSKNGIHNIYFGCGAHTADCIRQTACTNADALHPYGVRLAFLRSSSRFGGIAVAARSPFVVFITENWLSVDESN